MVEEKILYEVQDNIAVITLNRPKQRNAQDLELILQLDAAWSRAALCVAMTPRRSLEQG